jgi:hypothetical protein
VDDQILKFFLNTRTSARFAPGGAIEFVSGEFALPGENRFRFDDLGDVFPSFLPELSADLGQSQTLSVTELDTSLDLVTSDAVFGNEIRIAEQEFFVNRARNIG